MFIDYVTPDDDTITAEASFKYNKSTGESRYYSFNGMHRVIIDRQLEKKLTCDWIKDKIFVLTGFDEKIENKYKRIIEQAGGIVKSSTVLKTDYLIYNPDYDHETIKLKRAKELIEQGKNICLMTGAKFEASLQSGVSVLKKSDSGDSAASKLSLKEEKETRNILQLTGAETTEELIEKWFRYIDTEYRLIAGAAHVIGSENAFAENYFQEIMFGNHSLPKAGEMLQDLIDTILRIAYSDTAVFSDGLRKMLQRFSDGLIDDFSVYQKAATDDDFEKLESAFGQADFDEAKGLLSSVLEFTYSDGQLHVGLISRLCSMFVSGAMKCEDFTQITQAVPMRDYQKEALNTAKERFLLEDNGAFWTIKDYVGNEKVISIPGEIDGKPVVRIDDKAFSPNENRKYKKSREAIEEIIVPDTVKELGEEVFRGCVSLKKAVLSNGIQKLPGRYMSGMFMDCLSLQNIILPSGLKRIGPSCFANCKALKQIVVPNSVTRIGDRAFRSCDSLKELVFPSNVKVIEEYTCSGRSLERIVLPAALIEVKGSAFALAKNVREIVAPDHFVKWQALAIDEDCPWYARFQYDETNPKTMLKYISKCLIGFKGNYARSVCEDVFVDDGTVGISDFVFSYTSNIKRLHIPASVVEIGERAFFESQGITICAPAESVALAFAKRMGLDYLQEG